MAVVQKPENLQLVKRTLSDHFGGGFDLTLQLDKAAKETAADGEQSALRPVNSKELMEKSPRLKALVDKVDGEIIGVRKVDE
jgi:hypothetical protein